MTKERPKSSSEVPKIRESIEQPNEEDTGHEGSVTEDSDNDQQISKGPPQMDAAIKKRTEETVLDGAVLMVDQLWLWALESSMIIPPIGYVMDRLLLVESANTTVTFFPRVCNNGYSK